jgi:carboxymethylenebutenolidase
MEMLNPKPPSRLPVNRRQWLKSTAALTAGWLLLKTPGQAWAWPGSSDEQTGDVRSENIQYASASFKIDAYVASPAAQGVHPSLVLLHDDQGLNQHTREVVGRFAAAGFYAMAPDLLSRSGGTRGNSRGQVAEAIAGISTDATVEDLRAGYSYLRTTLNPGADRVSAVGLGWGGWRTYLLAANVAGLSRAVVYSGNAPGDGLKDIEASFLAHYGQFDFRMAGNALWLEKEMGKRFEYSVYPAVDHGFYDHASPQYNPEAAELAWSRTLDFLRSAA